MSGQHLRRIAEKLVTFEKTPKQIEGRKISDWFSLGEDIFSEFFKLGTSLKWDYSLIKTAPESSEVVTNITRNEEWLQTFLNIYPNLRIDLDLTGSAGDVCRLRSGVELLLRGFKGLDRNFDQTLQNLEDLGEVDELDRCLTVWVNTGHRPDFSSEEKQLSPPLSHWWWH